MPSTTSFQAGEVVLVSFPFTMGQQAKNRPALVLLDTGDSDVLVARITSQVHTTVWDVAVSDWQFAKLLVPSVIRLHKVATIEKTKIARRIGRLEPIDHSRVSAIIGQIFANW
jgi:mRNA interferase MazF